MHNSPEHIADAWFDERVEAYVDAELSDGDLDRFVERLKADSGLRGQVALAEQISLSLAARARVRCDVPFAERLADIRRRDHAGSTSSDRPTAILRLPVRWRWPVGVAAAALVATVFLVMPDGIGDRYSDRETSGVTEMDRSYTPAEIDEALREAKYALAIVGDAGRRAGTTVRETVIERNVVRPVNRAFEHTVYGPNARNN